MEISRLATVRSGGRADNFQPGSHQLRVKGCEPECEPRGAILEGRDRRTPANRNCLSNDSLTQKAMGLGLSIHKDTQKRADQNMANPFACLTRHRNLGGYLTVYTDFNFKVSIDQQIHKCI